MLCFFFFFFWRVPLFFSLFSQVLCFLFLKKKEIWGRGGWGEGMIRHGDYGSMNFGQFGDKELISNVSSQVKCGSLWICDHCFD